MSEPGVVRVDAGFEDEYPGADRTCTEAYASLCRTGEALLGELDRRVRLTFGIPQAAATALAVIDGAGVPLTPSQVSDRMLIASATMTATLDLLEHHGWIRRAAEVAASQPEPLTGQRIRPARLGGRPQPSPR